MVKREKYKRLVNFINTLIIIATLTAVFAWVWYSYFADNDALLYKPFFRRGNYALIALYALISLLFYRTYGATKVGYMRILESVYTQGLSVLCINAVTYLQLCLIGRWRFLSNLTPILWMTVIDVVIVVLWSFIVRFGYIKLYPPRNVLVVYGQYSPKSLITKMSARDDKYTICGTISIDRDMDEIKQKIRECGSVILLDLPAGCRNQLLKYCFRENIRCYSVPKISDIMLRQSEEIHLFDTSLLLFRNSGLSAEQTTAAQIAALLKQQLQKLLQLLQRQLLKILKLLQLKKKMRLQVLWTSFRT